MPWQTCIVHSAVSLAYLRHLGGPLGYITSVGEGSSELQQVGAKRATADPTVNAADEGHLR